MLKSAVLIDITVRFYLVNHTIKEYLDKHHVKYHNINHSPAYTAQEIAESAHISGQEMAKTVIVKLDGKLCMIVVPATKQIDFLSLKDELAVENASLASESDFVDLFPDCEVGTMPPLGELYNLDVYISEDLCENDNIAFNAGDYSDLVELKFKDFEKLVKPQHLHMN